jgi:thiol-disulfide isomerase/thioredoxin
MRKILVLILVVGYVSSCSFIPLSISDANKASDFNLMLYRLDDGQSISQINLNDYRGSTVVVNFWAIWCMPCRREMPVLQDISDEFKDRGLVVIGINSGLEKDADNEEIVEFLNYLNIDYPVGYGSPGSTIEQDYSIVGLPSTFLIDSEGNIRYKWLGEWKKDTLYNAVTTVLDN